MVRVKGWRMDPDASGGEESDNKESNRLLSDSEYVSLRRREGSYGSLDDLFHETVTFLSPEKVNLRKRPTGFRGRWQFPGWGEKFEMTWNEWTRSNGKIEETPNGTIRRLNPKQKNIEQEPLLSELPATAICGNDITSSCLYVTGLCIYDAGVFAPFACALASYTLYIYRFIYGEVGMAIPMDGGTFNILLNTSNKKTAAMAGCLSIISYIATGVVSAAEAVEYLHSLVESIDVGTGVIALLGFFALLSLIGIGESSIVATAIFLVHLFTLLCLTCFSVFWISQNGFNILQSNWELPHKHWCRAIFQGFSSAMLGVSGFESSSQYISKQAPGVFLKTLRNMWWAVAMINTPMSFFSLCVISVQELDHSPEIVSTCLAVLAKRVGGKMLHRLVCIDAFMVLAGSTLTAFVGVQGLVSRLAADRCLPEFLLIENRCRKTPHNIIIGFFLVCSSMYLYLDGQVAMLSSVYSIAFFSLLILFAVGCMMLKFKRGEMIQEVRVSWLGLWIGLSLVMVAFVSNLWKNVYVVGVFAIYYLCTAVMVFMLVFRLAVLKYFLYGCEWTVLNYPMWGRFCSQRFLGAIRRSIQNMNRPFMFFTKEGDLCVLNKAVLYIRENEDCTNITFVHVYEDRDRIPKNLNQHVHLLGRMYPKQKIDLALVQGKFGPAILRDLSTHFNTPLNCFFIGCPAGKLKYNVGKLGGVRIITHERKSPHREPETPGEAAHRRSLHTALERLHWRVLVNYGPLSLELQREGAPSGVSKACQPVDTKRLE
eukprot:g64774.t1